VATPSNLKKLNEHGKANGKTQHFENKNVKLKMKIMKNWRSWSEHFTPHDTTHCV